MPGVNAGIKRNRRPNGEVVISRNLSLSEETYGAVKAAAAASGNLSLSLYIERLAMQLRNANGEMPVIGNNQEDHPAAA